MYHLPLLIYHLNCHLRYSYFTTLKTTENLRFSGVWGEGGYKMRILDQKWIKIEQRETLHKK